MEVVSVCTSLALQLPYKIKELLVDCGERVKLNQRLFKYQIDQESTDYFYSDCEGLIEKWFIEAGSIVDRSDQKLFNIKSFSCQHPIIYGGLCAKCGLNLADRNDKISSNHDQGLSIDHNSSALCVSIEEAARIGLETTNRLLTERRLSLIVDLDQTIIHVTIDPLVYTWKLDRESQNYDACRDVTQFELLETHMGITRLTTYYVKQRPGLSKFLETLSHLYELHVYTMGTKAYAREVAKIIDPDFKFFGDRILSRTESGSLIHKNLSRLFPFDTSMVVVIDDRADVWSWSSNLIKVSAFEFFAGVGDINSGFLSKHSAWRNPDIEPDNIDASPDHSENQDNTSIKVDNVRLRNDDNELERLQKILLAVHAAFYRFYDLKHVSNNDNLKHPDVTKLITKMRMSVLDGTTLVFSGIIPLGQKVNRSEIGIWATTFGAKVVETLAENPTHLVVTDRKTAKVREALSIGTVVIVRLEWLLDSILNWIRQDESEYVIFQDPTSFEMHRKYTNIFESDIFESMNEKEVEKSDIDSIDFIKSLANAIEPIEVSTNFSDLNWDEIYEIDQALAESDISTENSPKRPRLYDSNSDSSLEDLQDLAEKVVQGLSS